MAAPKPTPLIAPADGGKLIAKESPDVVGITNYVEKVNFRREGEVEARREGWVKFEPNDELPPEVAQHLLPGVTVLAENVRPNSDRCVVGASATTIYRFRYETGLWEVIGTGYSADANPWHTETINGWIIFNNGVDLPVSYRVEDAAVTPMRELREVGIASVLWICEYNGFLICLNVREIKADKLADVMNGLAPYGLVDASLTNHIPYRVTWPEFGQPTNWAPAFKVTLNAASATIALPFPSSVFVAGTTRVAVLNGGPEGGTLGGDSGHPDGVLVTNVADETITLELSTDAGLSYPREVTVMRWTDISTMSAYKDLQDDASHLICGRSLNGMLAVYRTRGIQMGRYTANKDEPFVFGRPIKCITVPRWAEALADVGGELHIYPSADRFYAFDGVNPPQIHVPMDMYAPRLLGDLPDGARVRAINNPLTNEVWFCRPGFTVAYDIEKRTVSEIDAEIDAAAFVSRPGWEDDWFILAINGVVYTYGRVNGVATTWLRDGDNPGARLKWGRSAFGDVLNEKLLTSYCLLLADGQAAIDLRVRLYGNYTASKTPTLLLDEVIADVTVDDGLIPTEYVATYFQDSIDVVGDDDVDVRLVGRVFERALEPTGGISRNDA